MLRFRPLLYVSTISYALYLCHNNLGCALIHRFDQAGVPPQLCFLIAVIFSFAMAILITTRIEQPITTALRNGWNRYRKSESDGKVVTA
jgi:peptidoglycan/LPS O-acetylase OafA/YrhL